MKRVFNMQANVTISTTKNSNEKKKLQVTVKTRSVAMDSDTKEHKQTVGGKNNLR